MNIIHFKGTSILEQLQLEEALLRTCDQNYCIINEGSPPAIVMGISGVFEELVDSEKILRNPIPVIRRFSGGGTVVVDESTLFISFLFQSDVHSFPPYPEPILRWSADLYKKAFQIDGFDLRENDYVIGEKKVGGNAQYLRKGRWLHHTTFLWDYKKELMDLLLHPKKTPSYRLERPHGEFVTKLSEHCSSREKLILDLKQELRKQFGAEELALEATRDVASRPHRKSTTLIEIDAFTC